MNYIPYQIIAVHIQYDDMCIDKTEMMSDEHNRYMCSDEKKLYTPSTMHKLDEIINIERVINTGDLRDVVDGVKETMVAAAEPYKRTIRRQKLISHIEKSQWYDVECSKVRNMYNISRNRYNRSNNVSDLKATT